MVQPKLGVKLSIVVPVYNEEGNLQAAAAELSQALNRYDYEVIWVDDGSRDRSVEILNQLHTEDSRNRVIVFRRNYGQTAAMAAGFQHASGEVIIPIDADLQNDPRDIPALLAKLDEGYDVVSGWRKNRKDNWLRKLPSKIANRFIGRFTGVVIHDYGCTLKAYKKDVLKDVNLYGEMHRFIPALASAQGGKVAEIIVNHRARKAGQSKYGISRTFRVILDVLTVIFLSRFLTRPLHFFGNIALAMLSVSGVLAVVVLYQKFHSGIWVHRNPLFLLFCLLVIGGLQFIASGLLGELIARNYFESQGRTIFRVRNTLGL